MFTDICINTTANCSTSEWFLLGSGVFGAILLIYSQFVQLEHRRDIVRLLGAGGLFVYAYFLGNLIFMITAGGIGIAALIEFIEIMTGMHKHPDLKKMLEKPTHSSKDIS
jgi:hypothetical protein